MGKLGSNVLNGIVDSECVSILGPSGTSEGSTASFMCCRWARETCALALARPVSAVMIENATQLRCLLFFIKNMKSIMRFLQTAKTKFQIVAKTSLAFSACGTVYEAFVHRSHRPWDSLPTTLYGTRPPEWPSWGIQSQAIQSQALASSFASKIQDMFSGLIGSSLCPSQSWPLMGSSEESSVLGV
jgi:hypothetical protein